MKGNPAQSVRVPAVPLCDIDKSVGKKRGKREPTLRRKAATRPSSRAAGASFLNLEGCGTVRYASPSFRRILGYKPEEVFGFDSSSLL